MIPRHLRQEDAAANTDKIVSQDELRNFSGPLVILGEAGAGKTRLMQWLAESMGYAFCTARRLTTAPGRSRSTAARERSSCSRSASSRSGCAVLL